MPLWPRTLLVTYHPVTLEADSARGYENLLAALAVVDAVIVFDEDTPRNLIVALRPDVLVKGGDYRAQDIAGAEEVVRREKARFTIRSSRE